jgi:hypothetical protein
VDTGHWTLDTGGGWKRDGGWLYEDLKDIRTSEKEEQEDCLAGSVVGFVNRYRCSRKEWSKFNTPSESI